MISYSIAKDFSPHPMGAEDGAKFRNLLMVWLSSGRPISIDLDGTCGYASSFLHAAFSGIKGDITFISRNDLSLIKEIEQYRRENQKLEGKDFHIPTSVLLSRLEKHRDYLYQEIQDERKKTPRWMFWRQSTLRHLEGAAAAYDYEITQLLNHSSSWQPFWEKLK